MQGNPTRKKEQGSAGRGRKEFFQRGKKKRKINWIKGGFDCEFFGFSVGFLDPKWEVLKENLASEWQSQNVSMRKWEDGKSITKVSCFRVVF